MELTYIFHSGFVLETEQSILTFDHWPSSCSFSYNCYYQLSGAAVISVFTKVDSLPGSEVQTAIGDGDGNAYAA